MSGIILSGIIHLEKEYRRKVSVKLLLPRIVFSRRRPSCPSFALYRRCLTEGQDGSKGRNGARRPIPGRLAESWGSGGSLDHPGRSGLKIGPFPGHFIPKGDRRGFLKNRKSKERVETVVATKAERPNFEPLATPSPSRKSFSGPFKL